jgi:hypothetical protein
MVAFEGSIGRLDLSELFCFDHIVLEPVPKMAPMAGEWVNEMGE